MPGREVIYNPPVRIPSHNTPYPQKSEPIEDWSLLWCFITESDKHTASGSAGMYKGLQLCPLFQRHNDRPGRRIRILHFEGSWVQMSAQV